MGAVRSTRASDWSETTLDYFEIDSSRHNPSSLSVAMASDPYHTFASDLRSSLRSAQDLGQSYQDLRRSVSPSSPSLREAHDRLLDALEALQGDVADVKESVDVVERSGPERFGVAQEELEERRRFVKSCTEELRVGGGLVRSYGSLAELTFASRNCPTSREDGKGIKSHRSDPSIWAAEQTKRATKTRMRPLSENSSSTSWLARTTHCRSSATH